MSNGGIDVVASASTQPEISKPAFVLIHGGFHGAWTWTDVAGVLADSGYASLAIDLPGAGSLSQFPDCYYQRPIDLAQFAKTISPLGKITQQERTDSAIVAVRRAAKIGNGKVILVGHSWGGLTISHVAEAVPELVQAVVYLTAVLVPNGEPGGAIFSHPTFASSLVSPLIIGSDQDNGCALRIDPRSDDPAYGRAMEQAFYHDVAPDRNLAIANLLHCDEPIDTATAAMQISSGNYGRVARHYIHMADDRVLPPAAQDYMVERFDSSGIGGSTIIHRLSGGHSPMFANPAALRDVLVGIAS
ncbi:MAG: pimeloyl-ACP methyl ester carboxylesterase [Gammaproteobacteria bacterium]